MQIANSYMEKIMAYLPPDMQAIIIQEIEKERDRFIQRVSNRCIDLSEAYLTKLLNNLSDRDSKSHIESIIAREKAIWRRRDLKRKNARHALKRASDPNYEDPRGHKEDTPDRIAMKQKVFASVSKIFYKMIDIKKNDISDDATKIDFYDICVSDLLHSINQRAEKWIANKCSLRLIIKFAFVKALRLRYKKKENDEMLIEEFKHNFRNANLRLPTINREEVAE